MTARANFKGKNTQLSYLIGKVRESPEGSRLRNLQSFPGPGKIVTIVPEKAHHFLTCHDETMKHQILRAPTTRCGDVLVLGSFASHCVKSGSGSLREMLSVLIVTTDDLCPSCGCYAPLVLLTTTDAKAIPDKLSRVGVLLQPRWRATSH